MSLDLSVVIPAYNEEARLPPTLDRVQEWLRSSGLSSEVIVVDDGSQDGTVRVAEAAGVTVLAGEPNRGKGYAVRRGMLAARGARRLMTDADLSTPIGDVRALLAALDAGHDVAIASRALAGSNVEVRQPWYRENMGRLFNLVVRLLLLPDLHDTQCGFKLFTARAAEEAFGGARLDGFSFDVEVLYLAHRAGLRIAEVPVTWRNDEATRVRTLQGARAFLDVLRIRLL